MQRRSICPNLVIGDQPTEEEIRELKAKEYSAVVNLRHPEENGFPLGPVAEGEHVRRLGMDYLHVPFGNEPLSAAKVAQVVAFLDRHGSGKVYMHCKQGGRAADLALIPLARKLGWPARKAVAEGRSRGLELPPPVRAMMVEEYFAR